MGACGTKVAEAIPDRETMIQVVDAIVAFEDLLKRGQELTKTQQKEAKRVAAVAKEIKKFVKDPATPTIATVSVDLKED